MALLAAVLPALGEEGWSRRAREEMVALIAVYPGARVSDQRVLAAMRKVPRHEFVPPELSRLAYRDSPLPIGSGQTISQPLIVGFMSQALELKGRERVLEIGTGSGYQAAVLAELARRVDTIEIIPELAARAGDALKRLGYRNVFVKTADGYLGNPEGAPYDAIIVTCAPEHIPEPLVSQLKLGGRMIIPVGPTDEGQQLVLVRKTKDGMQRVKTMDVRFVPMTGKAREPASKL